MSKIKIKKNPNGDTRTAKKDVSFEEFQKSNDMHIEDVKEVMLALSSMLIAKGRTHDWTKKSKEELFYKNFLSTMSEGTDFVKDEWYQYHINAEKHHPLSKTHGDINLLDIIEMVVDCVCAGKSRSGEVRNLKIPSNILKLALENTFILVDNMTELEE